VAFFYPSKIKTMKKIVLTLIISFVAFQVTAQTTSLTPTTPAASTIDTASAYDIALLKYYNAKVILDNKSQEVKAAQTNLDNTVLPTEKLKFAQTLATAKIEKEKAQTEFSAKKLEVLKVAKDEDAKVNAKIKTTTTFLLNNQSLVEQKNAAIKSLESKLALSKGAAKTAVAKQITTAKSQKDKVLSEIDATQKALDSLKNTSKQTAENLKAATELNSQ
jgi:chromosome segregation ATPase